MIYQKSDFHYDLPDALIARYPLSERSASRLLLAEAEDAENVRLADYHV